MNGVLYDIMNRRSYREEGTCGKPYAGGVIPG